MNGAETRKYWVDTLVKIIDPPLTCGARRRLREAVPKYDQALWDGAHKDHYAYLEMIGRTLCGAAPWLAHPQKDPHEEALRQKYAALARAAIDGITDPSSPDRASFYVSTEENGGPFIQSLVDAAFLCHAVLRAKEELFDKLEERVKKNLISCLKETRRLRPCRNNWLLFSGMVEAGLRVMGEDADMMRVDYCLSQHDQWYKGDGIYGDGPEFHWDYYNSYVIHPMYLDIARVFEKDFPEGNVGEKRLNTAVARTARYARILELLIAPDGTFPPVGRSLTYRVGAFQALGQAALQGILPSEITPAQVRCAMTAAMHRCLDGACNYDKDGWLTIGLCAEQPDLGEPYICTGSLYLCTAGFLPLGLDADDPFWQGDEVPYSSQRIWAGENRMRDHTL